MSMPNDIAAFVKAWEEAWNAHDLERLLAHFAADVVFASPVASRLVPESGGVIRGRDALRSYWARGVELIPELRFEVRAYSVGIDAVVITYANQAGGVVNEVLIFGADGLVISGYGTYVPAT